MILRAVDEGAGPPLVLLHGLFGAASNFATIQRRLAASYRVIAFDLRNHGASPHDAAVSYDLMAGDVLDSLAALGTGPVALLGHSMGGKVAMQAALLTPGAITRLIVADIAPARYDPHFRDIAAVMRAIPLEPGLTRAAAGALLQPVAADPAVRAFLLQNLRFGAMPAWRIGLDEIAAALPTIEGWDPPRGSYGGPTLFLRGDRSEYVQAAHRPAIRGLFPAARFLALRDAGHWLHADAPDAFVAVVDGFLRRVIPGGLPSGA